MTREEAIEILERKTTIPDTNYTWAQIDQAIDTAITALRSMPEAGEPLTVEQLKQMDGKPVFLETGEVSIGEQLIAEWEILNWSGAGFFNFTRRKRMLHENNYGKSWFAYSYPPARIDEGNWGCEYCDYPSPHHDCVVGNNMEQLLCSPNGSLRDSYIYTREINFCPKCGKPLTEAAWAELERRLRG